MIYLQFIAEVVFSLGIMIPKFVNFCKKISVKIIELLENLVYFVLILFDTTNLCDYQKT
jgi:hypothetical protein